MALDEQKFLNKVDNEIKNYEVMKSIFNKIYDNESELNKKRMGAFDEIKKINEEDENLKTIYGTFTKKLTELEQEKDTRVQNIKIKIIPTTEELMRTIKNNKKDIGNYRSMKIKTQKQEKEKRDLDMSGDNLKSSQIQQNISRNKSIMEGQENSLQKGIMNYEYDRINNNKLIILHFINYEMAYHAKALEELTNLFKEVKKIGVTDGEDDHNDGKEDSQEDDDDDVDNDKKKISSSKNKSYKKSRKSEDEGEDEENDDEDKKDDDEIEEGEGK